MHPTVARRKPEVNAYRIFYGTTFNLKNASASIAERISRSKIDNQRLAEIPIGKMPKTGYDAAAMSCHQIAPTHSPFAHTAPREAAACFRRLRRNSSNSFEKKELERCARQTCQKRTVYVLQHRTVLFVANSLRS
jgi:hypothetical protein